MPGRRGRGAYKPPRLLNYDLPMALEEKLQALEALWDDLNRNTDSLEPPAWHADVLRERQQRLAAGEGVFMVDWEQAKIYIRDRTS